MVQSRLEHKRSNSIGSNISSNNMQIQNIPHKKLKESNLKEVNPRERKVVAINPKIEYREIENDSDSDQSSNFEMDELESSQMSESQSAELESKARGQSGKKTANFFDKNSSSSSSLPAKSLKNNIPLGHQSEKALPSRKGINTRLSSILPRNSSKDSKIYQYSTNMKERRKFWEIPQAIETSFLSQGIQDKSKIIAVHRFKQKSQINLAITTPSSPTQPNQPTPSQKKELSQAAQWRKLNEREMELQQEILRLHIDTVDNVRAVEEKHNISLPSISPSDIPSVSKSAKHPGIKARVYSAASRISQKQEKPIPISNNILSPLKRGIGVAITTIIEDEEDLESTLKDIQLKLKDRKEKVATLTKQIVEDMLPKHPKLTRDLMKHPQFLEQNPFQVDISSSDRTYLEKEKNVMDSTLMSRQKPILSIPAKHAQNSQEILPHQSSSRISQQSKKDSKDPPVRVIAVTPKRPQKDLSLPIIKPIRKLQESPLPILEEEQQGETEGKNFFDLTQPENQNPKRRRRRTLPKQPQQMFNQQKSLPQIHALQGQQQLQQQLQSNKNPFEHMKSPLQQQRLNLLNEIKQSPILQSRIKSAEQKQVINQSKNPQLPPIEFESIAPSIIHKQGDNTQQNSSKISEPNLIISPPLIAVQNEKGQSQPNSQRTLLQNASQNISNEQAKQELTVQDIPAKDSIESHETERAALMNLLKLNKELKSGIRDTIEFDEDVYGIRSASSHRRSSSQRANSMHLDLNKLDVSNEEGKSKKKIKGHSLKKKNSATLVGNAKKRRSVAPSVFSSKDIENDKEDLKKWWQSMQTSIESSINPSSIESPAQVYQIIKPSAKNNLEHLSLVNQEQEQQEKQVIQIEKQENKVNNEQALLENQMPSKDIPFSSISYGESKEVYIDQKQSQNIMMNPTTIHVSTVDQEQNSITFSPIKSQQLLSEKNSPNLRQRKNKLGARESSLTTPIKSKAPEELEQQIEKTLSKIQERIQVVQQNEEIEEQQRMKEVEMKNSQAAVFQKQNKETINESEQRIPYFDPDSPDNKVHHYAIRQAIKKLYHQTGMVPSRIGLTVPIRAIQSSSPSTHSKSFQKQKQTEPSEADDTEEKNEFLSLSNSQKNSQEEEGGDRHILSENQGKIKVASNTNLHQLLLLS